LAFTIVRVASGGLPVVESERGLPYYEADNGYGIPVTFGDSGIPLGSPGAAAYGDGPAPPGFHWEFVIDDLTATRVTDDATGQPSVELVGN
jgi:hypothetical protein